MARWPTTAVAVGPHRIALPRVRANLLRALVARRGAVVLTGDLVAATFTVWPPADPVACLRVHVARLRPILARIGVGIYSDHGKGYTLMMIGRAERLGNGTVPLGRARRCVRS
jgi:DNA-binding winged helix-turn-helix (wHTH) protein